MSEHTPGPWVQFAIDGKCDAIMPAMREGDICTFSKLGVTHETLLKNLREGGINQFYLKRPLASDVISTKCIRLDRQITHKKHEELVLRIKRNSDNSYEVISCE